MLAVRFGREEAVRVLVEVEGISLDTGDCRGGHRIENILEAAREEREERRREEEERRVRRELAARREVEVMRRDMEILLESAPNTGDYTLVCRGEELACHTNILLARCPTLAPGATWPEGEKGRWVVKSLEGDEVEVEVVRDLLTYIYTGTISEKRVKERVEKLLELAHMYQLPGLVDTCREAALQQITVDNSLHTLATLHKFAPVEGEDEQKEVAIRFVKRNLAKVKETKDWEAFASKLPDLVEKVEG